MPEETKDWDAIVSKATTLMGVAWMHEMVRATYGAVYVDEYQDCTILQHEFISAIGKIIPVEVLGDPLQGIFRFGGMRIVDWEKDIKPSFAEGEGFDTPWRWSKDAPDLGKWLAEVRVTLLAGNGIDLRKTPKEVTWIPTFPPKTGPYES